MDQTEHRSGLDVAFPLKTVLPWVGAILVATVAATFGITKYSASSHVSALTAEVEMERTRADRAEKMAAQAQASTTPPQDILLPQVTLTAALDRPELSALA